MFTRSLAFVVCAVAFAVASAPASPEAETLGPGDLIMLVTDFPSARPVRLFALRPDLGEKFEIGVDIPDDTFNFVLNESGDFFLATDSGEVMGFDPLTGAITTYPEWSFGEFSIEDLESNDGHIFVLRRDRTESGSDQILELNPLIGTVNTVAGGQFPSENSVEEIGIVDTENIVLGFERDPPLGSAHLEFQRLNRPSGSITEFPQWMMIPSSSSPSICGRLTDLTTHGGDAFALSSGEGCSEDMRDMFIYQLTAATGTRTNRLLPVEQGCWGNVLEIAPAGEEFVAINCDDAEPSFEEVRRIADGALVPISGSRFHSFGIDALQAVPLTVEVAPEPSAGLIALAALVTLAGLRRGARVKADRPRPLTQA